MWRKRCNIGRWIGSFGGKGELKVTGAEAHTTHFTRLSESTIPMANHKVVGFYVVWASAPVYFK